MRSRKSIEPQCQVIETVGATLLRCTGKLQREESVIHVVADRLDDLTSRLNTLRERTSETEAWPLQTAFRVARTCAGL